MTETVEVRNVITKNKRRMVRGRCRNCKRTQTRFITQKGGALVKTLNTVTGHVKPTWSRFPGEMHLPGHNFTGPGTKLNKRLNQNGTPKPWSKLLDRVDSATYRHDLAYARHWYGSRHRRRPHCIRRVPSTPRKGHGTRPLLGACLLWPRSPISATAELLFISPDGGRPPSWICGTYFETTREEYLGVLISVQKLVGIAAVVLITQSLNILLVSLEDAYSRLQNGFLGIWPT